MALQLVLCRYACEYSPLNLVFVHLRPVNILHGTPLPCSFELEFIMKGRGCCWKLCGARAMLAICQNKEALKYQAFRYLPLEAPKKPKRRQGKIVDKGEYLFGRLPIFTGPDQDKTWVKELYRFVHPE